jgi:hypothetical protein
MTGASGLFLHDLGVLDHRDPAALGHFALQCNRLAAVLSELIVHRLVFTDDKIGFAIADDPGGTAALDAFRAARVTMLFTDSVVIDVAHHIDDLAGHFFGRSRVVAVLVFLRDRQRRARQTCNEDRSHRNSQHGRFVIC